MQLFIHNKQKLTLEIHINYTLKTFFLFFPPPIEQTLSVYLYQLFFSHAANIPTA